MSSYPAPSEPVPRSSRCTRGQAAVGRAIGGSSYSPACPSASAVSSSPATASRSRGRVSNCPSLMRMFSWLLAVRTASRRLRARVRPASSRAVASSPVSRSSSAETRLDSTIQAPAAWSGDATRRSSGMSERANQAISRSAATKSSCQRLRRRARSRRGTATATATAIAASNHHHGVASAGAVAPAADDGGGVDDAGAARTGPVAV
jgi:hypothetical protein